MSATAPPRALLDQRFELHIEHKRGGMGTVWKARDLRTSGWVALKVLRDTSAEQVERFVREGGLLAQLSHRRVVGYVAHGCTGDGVPYLAMEWLEGENLAERLTRGPLSLHESLELLEAAVDGLSVVHAHGIVHRDLKPSNLFLRDRRSADVVLLDLGLARRADSSELTRTGSILGTPSYMPPEQIRGRLELAPSADIFSLGCVLFECLTGQPPFVGAQLVTVLAKVLFENAPRLRNLRPELPESLEQLLERMLNKDPGLRPRDATALRQALESLGRLPDISAHSSHAAELQPGAEEQELVSVILAVDRALGDSTSASAEAATLIAEFGRPPLLPDVSPYGARLEVLSDGAIVVTLGQHGGAATDLAARAARCALRLQALRPSWSIVLATGRGIPSAHRYIGEAVERAGTMLNTRSRQPAAAIWLDEVTSGLLDARFRTSRLFEAIVVYALEGEDESLDPARPLLGRPTTCVGRDHELGMLELSLEACIDESASRAVLLLGPPGIGKSRLRHEFLRHVGRIAQPVSQLLGLGDPMRSAGGIGLLGAALARLCPLPADASDTAKRDALYERLGRNVPEPERVRTAAFLGELSGIAPPLDLPAELRAARQEPSLMADRVAQAWLLFLRAELALGPLLIVLDDLQWCDALSISLVGQALRELRAYPLMVLALGRPETATLFPGLWSPRLQTLPLQPLGAAAMRKLVQQVLGAEVNADSVERMLTLAGGNALYLEELIRAADAKRSAVPQTVVTMLQARILLLPLTERRLLRAASVFGERFSAAGLESLLVGRESAALDLPPLLASLSRHEILEQALEDRPAQRWRFRHALTRDAAYALIKAEDVAPLHQAAAQYLESSGEESTVIADHYQRGQQPERAIAHYIAAAEQAARHNELSATLGLVRRGLDCDAAGEQRGVLRSIEARALYGGWDFGAAWAASDEALRLLPLQHPKRPESLGARAYCGVQVGKAHQLDAAIDELTLAEPHAGGSGSYLHSLGYCSISQIVSGNRLAASKLLRRISDVDALCGDADPFARGLSLYWQLRGAQFLGADLYAAYRMAERCALVNETAGNRRFLAFALIQVGECTRHLVSVPEGIAAMQRAAAYVTAIDDPAPALFARVQLSALLAEYGSDADLPEARALAFAAITMSAKGPGYQALAKLSLALVCLRAAELEEAERLAREATATLRALSLRAFLPHAYRTLLRVLAQRKAVDEASELAERALLLLEDLGPFGISETPLRLAAVRAHLAAGRRSYAITAARTALDWVQRQANAIEPPELRAAYANQIPENLELQSLGDELFGN